MVSPVTIYSRPYHTCSACDAEFESVAALTQHLPLHHDTCAVCNEAFDDRDSLRDHVHAAH
ncbi:C2H2-type zinc finger protein [Natrialba sp. INN-245]|uniref:C2H2-type zinc finger protein n=1 Tax=Natrialba sp. INN-245 TaxID=2690967 RepID=UPI0031B68B9F